MRRGASATHDVSKAVMNRSMVSQFAGTSNRLSSRPIYNVSMEEVRSGAALPGRYTVDSHDSHQIPTLPFKICPPLSEFTTI